MPEACPAPIFGLGESRAMQTSFLGYQSLPLDRLNLSAISRCSITESLRMSACDRAHASDAPVEMNSPKAANIRYEPNGLFIERQATPIENTSAGSITRLIVLSLRNRSSRLILGIPEYRLCVP